MARVPRATSQANALQQHASSTPPTPTKAPMLLTPPPPCLPRAQLGVVEALHEATSAALQLRAKVEQARAEAGSTAHLAFHSAHVTLETLNRVVHACLGALGVLAVDGNARRAALKVRRLAEAPTSHTGVPPGHPAMQVCQSSAGANRRAGVITWNDGSRCLPRWTCCSSWPSLSSWSQSPCCQRWRRRCRARRPTQPQRQRPQRTARKARSRVRRQRRRRRQRQQTRAEQGRRPTATRMRRAG